MSAYRQLPPDIADFTGRAAELRALHDRIPLAAENTAASNADNNTAVTVCAIQGMGGVGKTRLAVRLAHRPCQADPPYRWAPWCLSHRPCHVRTIQIWFAVQVSLPFGPRHRFRPTPRLHCHHHLDPPRRHCLGRRAVLRVGRCLLGGALAPDR